MQKHCNCKKLTGAGKLNALCCKTGWKVCMVGSRFTKTSEANYSPTEGELLGVVNALQKTKFFTLGCEDLFVGTDHKPLIGLLENTDLESMDNPRLLRLTETSPPNARVASMRTNNFKTLRLTKTLKSFSKHF